MYYKYSIGILLGLLSVLALSLMGSVASAATLSFTAAVSATPQAPQLHEPVAIHAAVKSFGGDEDVNNAIVDIEIYNREGTKVFQQFFTGQSFHLVETKNYTVNWTPQAEGDYRVKLGVFRENWASLYFWKDASVFFSIREGSDPLPRRTIDIWWPGDGSRVSGTFPLKALMSDMPVGEYQMFWQVDGGQLVGMYDSYTDWPHKEAWIDVSEWTWRGNGPYTINFEAKDMGGQVITYRMIEITIAR